MAVIFATIHSKLQIRSVARGEGVVERLRRSTLIHFKSLPPMLRKSVFFALLLWLSAVPSDSSARIQASDPYQVTKAYYEKLRSGGSKSDVAELRLFLSLMPKGGDIHHHFSGATYAESYLDMVRKAGCWVNRNDYSVICPEDAGSLKDTLSVDNLRKDNRLLSTFYSRWSDKDYYNHSHDTDAPDVQFFGTFAYFSKILSRNSPTYYREGISILKQRAKIENVQYIETMLVSSGYKNTDSNFDASIRAASGNEQQFRSTLDGFMAVIRNDPAFNDKVNQYLKLVNDCSIGVDDESFTLRYQSYVSRTLSPSEFFSGLVAAFYEASKSPLVVGVNVVSSENNPVSMSDYKVHMQMFRYLKAKFPDVKTTMHAGELTMGMVRPEELTFHISDALSVAGAGRIGHGVDIAYEANAPAALDYMRQKPVPVEICLTSNEFILGVKGNEHPIDLYARSGVPLVIATDDAGVSRNNLANEYLLLATRYGYSYDFLREVVGNSIRYSFMNEQDKRRNMQLLNLKFAEFESRISNFVGSQHMKRSTARPAGIMRPPVTTGPR